MLALKMRTDFVIVDADGTLNKDFVENTNSWLGAILDTELNKEAEVTADALTKIFLDQQQEEQQLIERQKTVNAIPHVDIDDEDATVISTEDNPVKDLLSADEIELEVEAITRKKEAQKSAE